jgi:hypothetical protein
MHLRRTQEHHEDLYEHLDPDCQASSVSRTRGIHATPAPRIGFHENAHVCHSCVAGAWGQFKGFQLTWSAYGRIFSSRRSLITGFFRIIGKDVVYGPFSIGKDVDY